MQEEATEHAAMHDSMIGKADTPPDGPALSHIH